MGALQVTDAHIARADPDTVLGALHGSLMVASGYGRDGSVCVARNGLTLDSSASGKCTGYVRGKV